jgi:hypothetical protein
VDQAPEPEWQPRTWGEFFECVRLACERLEAIARANPRLADTLMEAADHMGGLLRQPKVREYVVSFYRSLRNAIPSTRERLRREIAELLQLERKHWHELSESDLAALDTLHEEFTDRSLSGRMRHFVGPSTWDEEERADLEPLAKELLDNPEVLRTEWAWLTSGEAGDSWRLGEALAKVDIRGELERSIVHLPNRGPDSRVIGAYINARRRKKGDAWFESWMTELHRRGATEIPLFVDLLWRAGATEKTAALFEEILKAGAVEPRLLGQLSFGRWQNDISKETLLRLLREFIRKGQANVAANVVVQRVKEKPEEKNWWKPLALELAKDPDLIRSEQMPNWYWRKIALSLISEYPRDIVSAILKQQAREDAPKHWFAEFSGAKEVLEKAVALRPDMVWAEMAPFLSNKKTRGKFQIGFPKGLIDKIPAEIILKWIEEDPTTRASVIASIVGKDYSSDSTLASQVLGHFGGDLKIGSSFFSNFISGSWMGESSNHWDSLASQLEAVSKRTALPKLREWSETSAAKLRRMAVEDRVREEEERLRRY